MADTCPLDPPRGRERQVVLPPSRTASLNGDILITGGLMRPAKRRFSANDPSRWITHVIFFTRRTTSTTLDNLDFDDQGLTLPKRFLAEGPRRGSSESRDSRVCDEPFHWSLPVSHRLLRGSGHRGRLREETCHAKTEAPSARCGRLDGLIRHDMTDQFTTSSVNQALFPGQISAIFLSFPQSSHESTRRRRRRRRREGSDVI